MRSERLGYEEKPVRENDSSRPDAGRMDEKIMDLLNHHINHPAANG